MRIINMTMIFQRRYHVKLDNSKDESCLGKDQMPGRFIDIVHAPAGLAAKLRHAVTLLLHVDFTDIKMVENRVTTT